jgi:uncharacterized protein (TIGR00369 family)
MPELLHPTLSVDELRRVLAPLNDQPIMARLGCRIEVVDPRRVRVVIDPVEPFHRGGLQSSALNGGTLAAMFDLALGAPGLLQAHPDRRTATVQLSMSFMRAVRGSVLYTDGWINRVGNGILFTEGEASDEEGTVCATALGVVRLMEGYSAPRTF